MNIRWFHVLIVLAIGYALGYWMPQLGAATLGKFYAPKA